MLPVSTSQAKGVWSVCASLREKLRYVYRAAEGRYDTMLDTFFNKRSAYTKIQSEALIERLKGVTMLDTLFNERSACTKIQSEALIERLRDVTARYLIRSLIRDRRALRQSEELTDKRKFTNIAKLQIDLAYLLSDLKYSNTLSLRLRAVCAPHALHPVNEFDAFSVRNNTKPRNIKVQPP
jgi:hypothetical protein